MSQEFYQEDEMRVARSGFERLGFRILWDMESDYCECPLGTNGPNVHELLRIVGLDDLRILPGETIGSLAHIKKKNNTDGSFKDNSGKLWLSDCGLIKVKPEPDSISLVVNRDLLPEKLSTQYLVGIKLGYRQRNMPAFYDAMASQTLGMVVSAGAPVEAFRMELVYVGDLCTYAQMATRAADPAAVQEFTLDIGDIWALSPEQA